MSHLPKLILCLFCLVLWACDGEKTAGAVSENSDLRDTTATVKVALKGHFIFSATEDPRLCDPEQIVASDCAGGELFFLEDRARTVIYNFYCQGSDSISYILGNYETKDSAVVCRFEQIYNYLSDENDSLNQEIGRGSFYRSGILNSLVIKRAACTSFPFYFVDGSEYGGNTAYVLKTADSVSTRFFLENMRRIGPFQGYFK